MNQITFISNCGIQIEMDNIVIWADPYCEIGWGLWKNTPPDIKCALETYRPPFKKPDLLLLTHIHDDHYNREFTGRLLMENPKLLCIAPRLICDDLIQNGYAGVGGQMLLAEEVYDRVICRFRTELEIEVARTKHIGEAVFQTEHYAYCLNGSKRVLFAGDAEPIGENFMSFTEKGPVDVLAAPFAYITRKKNRTQVCESLRPGKLALVHIPDPKKDDYHFIEATHSAAEGMRKDGYQVEIMQKNLQQMAF